MGDTVGYARSAKDYSHGQEPCKVFYEGQERTEQNAQAMANLVWQQSKTAPQSRLAMRLAMRLQEQGEQTRRAIKVNNWACQLGLTNGLTTATANWGTKASTTSK